MALKNLTTREMAKEGADLVRPGSKERLALEAIPEAAKLIPHLEQAHAGVLAAQPPSESELSAIIDRITVLDVRHDDLIRSFIDRLASERTATTNEGTRDLMTRVLIALVPEGRSLVMRSYLEQAGAGVLREARITDVHRAVMAKLKTYDEESYLTLYAELQDVTAEIGRLEKSRTITEAENDLVLKTRDARNRWITAINTLASVLAMVGVDETPILLTIREAAHKAGIRAEKQAAAERAKKADGGTDGGTTDGGTTDTDGADTDVLDPPAPTDDEG